MKTTEIGKVGEHEPEGTKEAIHVPIVLARLESPLRPGDKVVFIDASYTKVRKWHKEISPDWHGIVDVFLPLETIGTAWKVWILLNPKFSKNLKLSHTFELDISGIKEVPEDVDDIYDSCKGCYDS